MKREILFRGKSNATNKWVKGGFTLDSIGNPRITTLDFSKSGLVFHEVIPETIGQFTGLTDKNGKEIFEGDIYNMGDKNILYVVVWRDCGLIGKQLGSTSYAGIEYWKEKIEIIGNIHDNPELLK